MHHLMKYLYTSGDAAQENGPPPELFIVPDKGMRAVSIKTKSWAGASLWSLLIGHLPWHTWNINNVSNYSLSGFFFRSHCEDSCKLACLLCKEE